MLNLIAILYLGSVHKGVSGSHLGGDPVTLLLLWSVNFSQILQFLLISGDLLKFHFMIDNAFR